MIASVNGFEMKYARFGEGEKNFVILPGLSMADVTDNAAAVEGAYSAFTKDYTVYLFDRRTNPPADYSLKAMADDTVAVLRSLGVKKADFFGASQGGMILQYIAINYPDLTGKIVLGSTMSRPNDYARERLGRWISHAKSGDALALAEDMIDSIYSEKLLKGIRGSLVKMFSNVTRQQLDKFYTIASATMGLDTYGELEKIKCPVLVLGSDGDRVTTAEASREIAEKLGCEIYMYDKTTSHAVFDEAPDYKDRILEFLRK